MTEFLNKSIDFVTLVFAEFYSRILVAVIILLLGFIIGKVAGKIVKKILHELEMNVIIKKATRIDFNLEKVIATFVSYFIYFITIIMVLNQLNITTTVLQMLSAAVIILVIISVLLAIKDFVPNVFAGFYIYRNKFIKKGETIKVKGMEGEVIDITIIETKIETRDGDIVHIPNSALTKTEIIKVKRKPLGKKKSR
ncbi:mechanosensitive ion channel family protein [Candidatus Woesearchaeota archaeon]|nr:mechanosensitive ion channel family protein [Candidatus Woesearchaeota archaeon]